MTWFVYYEEALNWSMFVKQIKILETCFYFCVSKEIKNQIATKTDWLKDTLTRQHWKNPIKTFSKYEKN